MKYLKKRSLSVSSPLPEGIFPHSSFWRSFASRLSVFLNVRNFTYPGKSLNIKAFLVLCMTALFFSRCAVQKAANMANCDYSISNISNISWAGVNLSNIKSYSDLNAVQIVNLSRAIANKDYTLHADINVLAVNNTTKTAEISGFDYQLLLDGQEIAEGNSAPDYNIRVDAGNKTVIPVVLRVNMLDFLSVQNIDNMLNTGKNLLDFGTGKPSKVTFKFRPWIKKTKMPYISLSKTIN